MTLWEPAHKIYIVVVVSKTMTNAKTQYYQELRKAERQKLINRQIQHSDLKPNQQEELQALYEHLLAQGRTAESAAGYITKASLYERNTGKTLKETTQQDITRFLARYSDKSVSYQNGLKITLSVTLQWAQGINKEHPLIKGLKINRKGVKKKTDKDVLSQEEILQMAEAAENFRNRFLITGGYESACRKSEFIGLRIGDVELKDKYAILHVDGKTGQRPVLLINSFPDLVNHLNHHPLRDDQQAPLFLNQNGLNMIEKQYNSLGNYGFNDILRKLGKKAGLKKKVYPHVLRHSRLTHLAREGFTEVELRRIAGWTATSTMADTYVHQNDQQIMNKRLQKAGLIDEQKDRESEELLKPHSCQFCGEHNPAGVKFCGNCGRPLIVRDLMDSVKEEEKIRRRAAEREDVPFKQAIKQVMREMIKAGELEG